MIRGIEFGGSFIILAFLSLFILLPIGMRDDAPPTMKLSTKFMLALLSGAILWCILYGFVWAGVINF